MRLQAYEPLYRYGSEHRDNCTTVSLTVNKLQQSTQLHLVSHHKRSLVLFYQYATPTTSPFCITNSVEEFFIQDMLEQDVEVCILNEHTTTDHQVKFKPGKCLETKR